MSLGAMPTSSMLGALGLRSISATGGTPSVSQPQHVLTPTLTTIATCPPLLSTLLGGESSKTSTSTSDSVVVALGIPALRHTVVNAILAGKFVDLGELPPAEGFSKSLAALASGLEGKVVLIQASDLIKSRKVLPNLGTWIQCFAVYTGSDPVQVP